MNAKKKTLKTDYFHYDPLLVASSLALLLIGYVMVVSSSLHLFSPDKGGHFWDYPLKQFLHILLGVALAKGVSLIPLRVWQKLGPILFVASVLLLMLVLIPGFGKTVNGSTRWLFIAGIGIQVSEALKFAAVIYMAGYVNRHHQSLRESAFGLFKPLLLFSVASMLLLLEPDFGSAVVVLMIAMGIMFLAGAKLSHFTLLFTLVLALAALLVIVEPYRMKRVVGFMDPFANPLGEGYQLSNALICFGDGGILGKGLGNGIQKLSYLPEAHTDFLFSVIAEELGLIGVALVIALFSTLVWRAFQMAERAEKTGEKFAAYLAYGLGVWFGFQAFVNMGVNMGMLPTKGLTLPLMSYGGGSMIIMCCAVGLLFRVYSEVTEINASNVPEPKVRAKRVPHA